VDHDPFWVAPGSIVGVQPQVVLYIHRGTNPDPVFQNFFKGFFYTQKRGPRLYPLGLVF